MHLLFSPEDSDYIYISYIYENETEKQKRGRSQRLRWSMEAVFRRCCEMGLWNGVERSLRREVKGVLKARVGISEEPTRGMHTAFAAFLFVVNFKGYNFALGFLVS